MRRKAVLWRSFAFFAMLPVLCPVASAQDYRGSVQGVVTDQTQAAVAEATVVLRNVGTNIEATKQTDAHGLAPDFDRSDRIAFPLNNLTQI